MPMDELAFGSVFLSAMGWLLVAANHKSGGNWQDLVVYLWLSLHRLGWAFVPYLLYGLYGALASWRQARGG